VRPGAVGAPVGAAGEASVTRKDSGFLPPYPQAQQGQGQEPACHSRHAGLVEQRGGLAVALLGASRVRCGRRGSHGPVPAGEHGDGWSFVEFSQLVKGGGLRVGAGEVTAAAERLQPDEPSEDLEVDQPLLAGEGHDLRADRVAPRGEPGPGEGLHPGSVEGEGEQRGIAEAAGDRPRLGCRLAGAETRIAA